MHWVGVSVGAVVGRDVGNTVVGLELVGVVVGFVVGARLGVTEGCWVGWLVGARVVGLSVGRLEGELDGSCVGLEVGLGVGGRHAPTSGSHLVPTGQSGYPGSSHLHFGWHRVKPSGHSFNAVTSVHWSKVRLRMHGPALSGGHRGHIHHSTHSSFTQLKPAGQSSSTLQDCRVGACEGCSVGAMVGKAVGCRVEGARVGLMDGRKVGSLLGLCVGIVVGEVDGVLVGPLVGASEGVWVGLLVVGASDVGARVGLRVGPAVGDLLGFSVVGLAEGEGVGLATQTALSSTKDVQVKPCGQLDVRQSQLVNSAQRTNGSLHTRVIGLTCNEKYKHEWKQRGRSRTWERKRGSDQKVSRDKSLSHGSEVV